MVLLKGRERASQNQKVEGGILSKTGFVMLPGKGSHTVWKHRALPGVEITLAGHDGDDAKPYQTRDVQNALKQIGREL